MTAAPRGPTPHSVAVPWHARPRVDVLGALAADPARGLSAGEAQRRLAASGPNSLGRRREAPWWEEVLESLREPLQLLLLAVGGVYLLLGEVEDAMTILVVVAAVSGAEAFTELRARRAIGALRSLGAPRATVVRDGRAAELPAADLVPGDVVLLQPGDRVGADLRLVESAALRVDESSLTGESVPVAKNAGARLAAETELGDRRTMAFSGTLVSGGRGRGVVVATGRATELGRIVGLAETAREPRTPLQQAMRQLSGWLVWVALGFSALVPLLGVLVARQPWQEMLLTGLTLAFATVPEELPILITIVLGLGAYRLARRKAIVRRLRAAETLGSVSVVGTDKTGTLTRNRMQLARLDVDGAEQALGAAPLSPTARRLLEIGVLASDAQAAVGDGRALFVGDPTETALLRAAADHGLDVEALRAARPVLEEQPFDDRRRRMSAVVACDGQRWLALKGAPESVLACCSRVLRAGRAAPLDGPLARQLQASADAMSARGLRVLGFAERRLLPDEPPGDVAAAERELTFVGLAGLEDPPRPEVPAAVAALRAAGVRVLMLTGDHPATARAVAERVGIEAQTVVRGRELDGLSERQLADLVGASAVFARITAEHKLRIVRAVQAGGALMAVTGDGVNDGPALREAAVGVAMGRTGTDVAREAADLVLADDDFATVAAAVGAGRVLFANLRKAVRYYLAAKVALVLASLVPVLAGLPVPFGPLQIIVLELFMDLGASTTFVVEPPEEDVMRRPPRDPRRPFMDRAMQLGVALGGLTLAATVLVAYLASLAQGAELASAQTAAFSAWLVGHVVLAAHMRAEHQPLLRTHPLANRPFVVWATLAVALAAIGPSVPPLAERLRLVPLAPTTWAVLLGAALLLPAGWEAWKWARWRVPPGGALRPPPAP